MPAQALDVPQVDLFLGLQVQNDRNNGLVWTSPGAAQVMALAVGVALKAAVQGHRQHPSGHGPSPTSGAGDAGSQPLPVSFRNWATA
ncbi:MAG: hypothetical protein IID14_08750, partial [Candidatus Marinimicrobia bacterium]|nr:hypothetical protein [Candidatus Neomarinimicrobiota bacterium]